MNTIAILILLNFFSCGTGNSMQTKSDPDKKDTVNVTLSTPECSSYYSFNNQYVDLEGFGSYPLEMLISIQGGGTIDDFKVCSKYSHRFINPIADSIVNNDYTYEIVNDKEKKIYRLNISRLGILRNSIDLPVENPLPEVHEYYIHLFPYKNDVIMFMEDMYTTHYYICKYNSKGEELMRKDVEHTYITHPEPTTNYMHRYLYFSEFTSSQMIFTSHMAFADKFKTILLNMDDFTIKEYDKMAHGYILDENDAEFMGFVTSKKDYEGEKQPVNFEISMINDAKYNFSVDYGSEACDFLLKDSLLYIGNYHPISTGSSLHCFDMRTGKMKWTADVLQVNASHSEYWNKVTLSMYKDKLIMQGDEAYGSYLQIFDAKTGKRLAHFGNVMEEKK